MKSKDRRPWDERGISCHLVTGSPCHEQEMVTRMCRSVEYVEDVPIVAGAVSGDHCPECQASVQRVVDRCVWTEEVFAFAQRVCTECGAVWEVVFRPCAVRIHH